MQTASPLHIESPLLDKIHEAIVATSVLPLDDLLPMESWDKETACAAVIGNEHIPAEFYELVRSAVAEKTLTLLPPPVSDENSWQFAPRMFLLWCRKNGIALRKSLSLWLDADTPEYARAEICWQD
jgi:hypothetical protein